MATTKKTTTTKKKSTTKKKKVVTEETTDEQIVDMIKEEKRQEPVETEETAICIDDAMMDITIDEEPIDDGSEERHLEPAVPPTEFEEQFIEYETEDNNTLQNETQTEENPEVEHKKVLLGVNNTPKVFQEHNSSEKLEPIEKEKKDEPKKKLKKKTTRYFYGYDLMGVVYDY